MLKITSDLKAAPGNSIIYEKKSGEKKKKKKPSPWEVQIQLWKIHKGDLGESISGNLTAPAQCAEQQGDSSVANSQVQRLAPLFPPFNP